MVDSTGDFVANYGQAGVLVMRGSVPQDGIIKLPDKFGRTDAHIIQLSVVAAGIPDDYLYSDNGFTGFRASASALSDMSGWQITAKSVDTASGGDAASLPHGLTGSSNFQVEYMVFRIIDFKDNPPEP